MVLMVTAEDAVYQLPFIGLDPKDARKVADSFNAFVPPVNLTRPAAP